MSRPLAQKFTIIEWLTRRLSVLFSSFQSPHMTSSRERKQEFLSVYWGLVADSGGEKGARGPRGVEPTRGSIETSKWE